MQVSYDGSVAHFKHGEQLGRLSCCLIITFVEVLRSEAAKPESNQKLLQKEPAIFKPTPFVIWGIVILSKLRIYKILDFEKVVMSVSC